MNKDPLFSREKELTKMFDDISSKYDLINHILSFGIDFLWRRKAVHLLSQIITTTKEKKKY
ncbi:class I SAM-dependent methyltransferase [Blattabacterium cuenoti]|uniref:class I SAM-dependent methyltransferase n=1 Tax=Blattabacterium cuenoti TaxID=1653831 RepID=UPI0021D0461A|nr:class I SAM-dependent methyltransferase [Blattabacterium cuenoti]